MFATIRQNLSAYLFIASRKRQCSASVQYLVCERLRDGIPRAVPEPSRLAPRLATARRLSSMPATIALRRCTSCMFLPSHLQSWSQRLLFEINTYICRRFWSIRCSYSRRTIACILSQDLSLKSRFIFQTSSESGMLKKHRDCVGSAMIPKLTSFVLYSELNPMSVLCIRGHHKKLHENVFRYLPIHFGECNQRHAQQDSSSYRQGVWSRCSVS